MIQSIGIREEALGRYWEQKDPINETRSWWRAQVVRHSFHLLPGERILELGAGQGRLTAALDRAMRGSCPIVPVAFSEQQHADRWLGPGSGPVEARKFFSESSDGSFDCVVGTNVLDFDSAEPILQEAFQRLKPGGRLLLFESNPWNPFMKARMALVERIPGLARGDERPLPNQKQLFELVSEMGFIRVSINCWDFLYPPIPKWMMLPMRNLSLILENTPGVRLLAGSILVQAQKPPRTILRPPVRMSQKNNLTDAVSIVIPCHNEEMNVEPQVRALLDYYGGYVREIVLVDDNSQDGTRQVIERLALADPRIKLVARKPPNGVGRALREGIDTASGDWVLLMDCDFVQVLPELREMFDAADAGYDLVLGSRFSRESILINYPLSKILFNRVFHVLANLLFHRRMRDVTNNLKLMRREVARSFQIDSPWFAANAETGLKPILMGFSVHAVPISWINRTPGQGKSSFALMKNGGGYARVLFSLARRTACGFRRLERKPGSVEKAT